MSSVLSSIISSFFGSSEMKMKMKDVFYTIIQFLNINNHENENDSTITTASLVFNLILVYLVVFIVVFVVVMTYQFYSNFIHLTSCLDHINECHIERRSQQQEENNKLGKYATILIGSGSQHGGGGNTRNSAIVGLLYTRVRIYVCLFSSSSSCFVAVSSYFFLIPFFLWAFPLSFSHNIPCHTVLLCTLLPASSFHFCGFGFVVVILSIYGVLIYTTRYY